MVDQQWPAEKKPSFNLNKLYHCRTPRPQMAANIYSTGDMIVFCLEHYNNIILMFFGTPWYTSGPSGWLIIVPKTGFLSWKI
jgi:hypothetical protein